MSNRLDLTGATSVRGLVADLPDGTFAITVADGPGAGQRLELDGSSPSRLLVGKSSTCDLRLDDPEVSRRHCALEITGARLRVTDLGSTNGTFVDHVAIRDAWLSGGETLRVGATRLRVERHAGGQNPPVPPGSSFGRMLGASRAMRRLYPLCRKLAVARVSVLIEGETGTGKEVLAEALHEEGPLAARPFVVFDCTAVPPSLVESELFGHERGAFTGATAARRGVFEQADGGTLFIDEIGDLDPALQPKLLRAIERGEIRRVGGDRWIRVDARILSATRRDLDHEVQAGRFRDDLFHRLAVARIELPPLRARAGDVALLAAHFWRLAGADGAPPPALIARWSDDAWPGNLRELRNAVLRAVALGDATLPPEEPAEPEAAPASASRGGAAPEVAPADALAGADFMDETLRARLPLAAARARVVEEFERRYVEQVLADHDGVVSRAAAASGIARRHFQRIKARSR
ncbi:sigma 54-interacting transcriptional regulator [Sorangium sp. So ce321]|uniref:sigma 54-interacting transcriptional regulator n=1 Tax=Sorangium sp. So ce321 TaxID=3133300 RepID=UPI003F618F49